MYNKFRMDRMHAYEVNHDSHCGALPVIAASSRLNVTKECIYQFVRTTRRTLCLKL